MIHALSGLGAILRLGNGAYSSFASPDTADESSHLLLSEQKASTYSTVVNLCSALSVSGQSSAGS